MTAPTKLYKALATELREIRQTSASSKEHALLDQVAIRLAGVLWLDDQNFSPERFAKACIIAPRATRSKVLKDKEATNDFNPS